MASGDFCEHDWPGSGCKECAAAWEREKAKRGERIRRCIHCLPLSEPCSDCLDDAAAAQEREQSTLRRRISRALKAALTKRGTSNV